MRPPDGKRDSASGAALLTLRITMALSQAELANYVGVSRQAVGEWEGGRRYPKAEHLKALIALAVKLQAFAADNVAEEIHLLWRVAHQKKLLDERWLSALLEHLPSPDQSLVPLSVEETRTSSPITANRERRSSGLGHDHRLKPQSLGQAQGLRPSGPHVDWGDALAIPIFFYGREQEMAQLSQWILQERARVVCVLGMGGIGKSALAVNLMYWLGGGARRDSGKQADSCSCPFDVIIFRSLRDAPPCGVLLDDYLRVLSPQLLNIVPATLEQRIGQLLGYLRKVRVLMVLDNLESVLEVGDTRGHFRPGFGGYGQLLRRVLETGHQSCLLLTSREKPAVLREHADRYSRLRTLRLAGLDSAACQQLFMEKEINGTKLDQEQLTLAYSGNPLALKIVAETISDLFAGAIGAFLASRTLVFGSITELLDEQFARLSALERSVLYWLAIGREPVTPDELQALLIFPLSNVQLLAAVDALLRRCLIEPGKRPGSFTLQSVVLEYVTTILIAEGSREIQHGRLDRLLQHGLELAQAPEYVRKSQERLLLVPLLAELQSVFWSSRRFTTVEEQLLDLLDQLRKETDTAQGYGPANVIALLRVQRGHLRALDLSHLSIRSAYLQGIEMQDTNLAEALMRDTAWTEALDAIWGVAISSRGTWWAAGSRKGEVRMWDGKSQTLNLVWQAHYDIVPTLAFSPDEHILATGSWDGTVKLWNLRSHEAGTSAWLTLAADWEGTSPTPTGPQSALLWMGEHTNVVSLAFSPDGSMLASCGRDTTVKLWDTQNGTSLQALEHPGYVFAVAFSPDGQLLATGGFDGCIRLWQIEMSQPSTCIQTLWEHTNWVMGLAFAPDGRTLASGSWDNTIKLWDVASARMLQTLEAHTDNVHGLAWSPDGRTLVSCSVDKTIRVFDIDLDERGGSMGDYRSVLHGHTFAVYDLCFAPDGSRLLSGSEDGTLRVWEVESGKSLRIIQGYAVSFSDIDWSPDGTQLVSGGTDGIVTIWDTIGDTPPRVLRGHRWIIWGTGWSLGGEYLASSEHAAIHLWDPTSGACIRKLQDPVASSAGVAWSPVGQLLACATLNHGVQVWDITTGKLRWPARTYSSPIRHVSWSPDGKLLTAGNDEGTIYQWDATDGRLLRKLRGHHGSVMRVTWSPDGRLLASCGGSGGNGELFLWDNISGERVRTFVGCPGMLYALVWSLDGDWLITGGSDGILRWWDAQSGECVLMRKAHRGTILSLRRSPDGGRLASCGDDGALMIWDLKSCTHLRTLRRDRPYERLNIAGIRGLTEAEIASLQALGAIEQENQKSRPRQHCLPSSGVRDRA